MVTQRTKRLTAGIASGLVSRGVGLLAPIVLIPFALRTIGAERYGLWAAATSLTAIALFADLGLGNGLMTRLSATFAANDIDRARRLIASAYVMAATIALSLLMVVVAVFVIFSPASLVADLGNVPSGEANLIVAICLAGFVVNIPISLITRVQYGFQQVAYSNFWAAGASIASASCFVVVAELWDSATLAVAAAVFAVPAVALLNSLVFFARQRPDLSPIRTKPSKPIAISLIRVGGQFFVLSVLTSLALNLDPLFISNILGLEATAEYSVGWRLVSGLGLMVTLVNLPLWPANGEALARGDVGWVKRTTVRMVAFSVALVLLGGLLILGLGRGVIESWLSGTSVDPSGLLLAALVFWNVLLAAASPIFMVQNSVGLVWPQLISWSIFLVVAVPLKLIGITTLGVAGGVLSGSVIYLLVIVPFTIYGMRLALRKASQSGLAGSSENQPTTDTAAAGI